MLYCFYYLRICGFDVVSFKNCTILKVLIFFYEILYAFLSKVLYVTYRLYKLSITNAINHSLIIGVRRNLHLLIKMSIGSDLTFVVVNSGAKIHGYPYIYVAVIRISEAGY